MKMIKTKIEGLLIINPELHIDSRGSFQEIWNYNKFLDNGLSINFLQDNESHSKKNVLRGLHFQNPPNEQGKLVRVIKGSVLDVAVDIRKNSPTYGEHFKIKLCSTNKLIFWIPPGFAHGFLSLEDDTIFAYKCSGTYNKSSEDSLLWNDTDLNIDWGIDNPIVSNKDIQSQKFKDFSSLFI